MTEVIVVPGAEAQIRAIDGWWREHRTAAPELFAQELAAAIALIQSSPRMGRRRRHAGVSGLRRVLLRSTRYHLYYVRAGDERLFVRRCSGTSCLGRVGGLRLTPQRYTIQTKRERVAERGDLSARR